MPVQVKKPRLANSCSFGSFYYAALLAPAPNRAAERCSKACMGILLKAKACEVPRPEAGKGKVGKAGKAPTLGS